MVGDLQRRFGEEFGETGEGFIRAGEDVFAGDPARWSVSGGAALQTGSSVGAFKQSYLVNGPSQVVSITLPVCTEIGIVSWWSTGGTAVWEYRVDGGSWTTHAAQSGSDTFFTEWIDGLSNTAHTLDIRGGAGNGRIIGVIASLNRTSGVAVHRVGFSGAVLKDLTSMYDASDANGIRSIRSATRALGAHLVVLHFSANNVTGGWTTYQQSLAQIATGFGRVIDQVITDGACVLCVGGPWRNPTSYSSAHGGVPFTQQEADDAIKAVCAERTHAAFLDLKRGFKSLADEQAKGYIIDTIHLTRKGHANAARMLHNALGAN